MTIIMMMRDDDRDNDDEGDEAETYVGPINIYCLFSCMQLLVTCAFPWVGKCLFVQQSIQA